MIFLSPFSSFRMRRSRSRSVRSRSLSRRESKARSRRSLSVPGPLVAFLLIASFGILFAGCGNVKGPNDPAAMEDTTFTADEMEQLANAEPATGGEGAPATVNPDLRQDGGTGAVAAYPAIDAALQSTYDAIRSAPDSSANTWRVVNDFLNVRAEPGVGAATIGRLTNGEAVELVEFVNASWAKIQLSDGQTGYVSARYIAKVTTDADLPAAEKAYDNLYFVDYGFVNVRQAPDTRSEKLGEVPGQDFLKPLSIDDEWARIPYAGKEAFVSAQFLSPFRPSFLIRQNTFDVPILQYSVDQPGMLDAMKEQTQTLRRMGKKLITLRDLYDVLLLQEKRDAPFQPGSVVIAVSGLSPENVREVSTALYGLGVRATLFLQTQYVGVSGITEKQILTLIANGFDVQSGGHTGDDLRTLTSAQLKLELAQSRVLLESMTHRTVFAIAYPQGGVNDRVVSTTANSGYLFGLADGPKAPFSRDQFLRLPGITLKGGVTTEEVLKALE